MKWKKENKTKVEQGLPMGSGGSCDMVSMHDNPHRPSVWPLPTDGDGHEPGDQWFSTLLSP